MTSENGCGTVELGEVGPSEVERTYDWVRDPWLRERFLMRGEVTPDGHRAYFASVLADPTQRVHAVIADGRHVGNAGLKRVLPGDSAEMWIYIGEPAARRRGVARRTTELLLAEAFGELGARFVYLHVAQANPEARGLYERLGFREVPLSGRDALDWAGRGVVRMELHAPGSGRAASDRT